jgi:hypothetical protein
VKAVTLRTGPASPRPRGRRRQIVAGVVVGSIIVHLIIGVVAGFWIVARYFASPPATFEVRKDLAIPAEDREHRMRMAEFDGLTPKPTLSEKLVSMRPTDFALPDLPQIPLDQMLPLDPSALVSDQITSLAGAAGKGAGGLGGTGDGFSFFGIESKGRRVVLVFDVSSSVMNKAAKAGISPKALKEETRALIAQLGINTRFGLVQMTQNYQAFKGELLAATEPNKEAARAWIDHEWTEEGQMPASRKGVASNPRGLVGVLEFALQLEPDTVFLISDGSFQWREAGSIGNIPPEEIRDVLKKAPKGDFKLHFIGFEMKPEDRNAWRRFARGTGGDFRELEGK